MAEWRGEGLQNLKQWFESISGVKFHEIFSSYTEHLVDRSSLELVIKCERHTRIVRLTKISQFDDSACPVSIRKYELLPAIEKIFSANQARFRILIIGELHLFF